MRHADLLATLRVMGRTDEDVLDILRALASSMTGAPHIQDALDGAVGEIEGYQDRQRDLAREAAEADRPMRTRLTWAQRMDESQGVPSFFTKEAVL